MFSKLILLALLLLVSVTQSSARARSLLNHREDDVAVAVEDVDEDVDDPADSPTLNRLRRRRGTTDDDEEEEEEEGEFRWGKRREVRREIREDLGDLRAVHRQIQKEQTKLSIAELDLVMNAFEEEENVQSGRSVTGSKLRLRSRRSRDHRHQQRVRETYRLIERRAEEFERFCENNEEFLEEREVLLKHESLYDESDEKGNVVLIEAWSPFWNGFGNNMRRWSQLFAYALRFDEYATYFDFGACGREEYGRTEEDDGTASDERRSIPFRRKTNKRFVACQFDPGTFFKGKTFDWQWSPKRARENRARLGIENFRKLTILCERDEFIDTNERDCSLYNDDDVDTEKRALKVGVRKEERVLASSGRIDRSFWEEPSDEKKIEKANAHWLSNWLAKQLREDRSGKGVKIRLLILDVYTLQREGELISNGLKNSRFYQTCVNRHFFTPKENLKKAIDEVFEHTEMKNWETCAAIHLRTGFADHQAKWVDAYKKLSFEERTKFELKYPCNDAENFIDALDETFRKCEPDYSNVRMCTLWHAKNIYTKLKEDDEDDEGGLKTFSKDEDCCGSKNREPDVRDAMELCAEVPENLYPEMKVTRKGDDDNDGGDNGEYSKRKTSPIRAALTCALRVAKHSFLKSTLAAKDLKNGKHDSANDDKFGVYLLGDSPAFIKSVPKLETFGKYFANQRDPDIVGVTMENNDCSGTSCVVRKGEENHLSWLRSVVDAYIASLCETTMQLPGSSFANGAIHQLRAPDLDNESRSASAMLWSGEVVIGQELPKRNPITKEIERRTKIGYDSKLENYIALSAAHCVK